MEGLAVVAAPATPPEAAAAANEAAVDIAEIQADRDVRLAEIAAETAEAIAETEADDLEDDVQWLRDELAGLQARCATAEEGLSSLRQVTEAQSAQITELAAMLQTHLTQLTPPAHSPPATEETPAPSEEDGPRESAEENEPPAPTEEAPARRRVRRL